MPFGPDGGAGAAAAFWPWSNGSDGCLAAATPGARWDVYKVVYAACGGGSAPWPVPFSPSLLLSPSSHAAGDDDGRAAGTPPLPPPHPALPAAAAAAARESRSRVPASVVGARRIDRCAHDTAACRRAQFGGTSCADAAAYRRVAALVLDYYGAHRADTATARLAVVVSAMSGVTDALLGACRLAAAGDAAYRPALAAITERHYATVRELQQQHPPGTAPALLYDAVAAAIGRSSEDLAAILHAALLTRSCSDYHRELVSGHGELWSAQILNALLQTRAPSVHSQWLDARLVLRIVGADFAATMAPAIDWEASRLLCRKWLETHVPDGSPHAADVVVITGFIASTSGGMATTLKRNGSDYSASVFGNLLDAQTITIWTDVDGIYNADPRRAPAAERLTEMTYSEAVEFSFYGAKIVHPMTMAPAVQKRIPIWIRNTFNARCPGTVIRSPVQQVPDDRPVRGLCTIDDIALVNVTLVAGGGPSDDYTPLSVRSRLLDSLRSIHVPLVMMAQAAPEHAVCFCVPEGVAERARDTIQAHFSASSHHRVELIRCAGAGVAGPPACASRPPLTPTPPPTVQGFCNSQRHRRRHQPHARHRVALLHGAGARTRQCPRHRAERRADHLRSHRAPPLHHGAAHAAHGVLHGQHADFGRYPCPVPRRGRCTGARPYGARGRRPGMRAAETAVPHLRHRAAGQHDHHRRHRGPCSCRRGAGCGRLGSPAGAQFTALRHERVPGAREHARDTARRAARCDAGSIHRATLRSPARRRRAPGHRQRDCLCARLA